MDSSGVNVDSFLGMHKNFCKKFEYLFGNTKIVCTFALTKHENNPLTPNIMNTQMTKSEMISEIFNACNWPSPASRKNNTARAMRNNWYTIRAIYEAYKKDTTHPGFYAAILYA